MAYWSIPSSQQIDYSPNGDDIDSFSQKVQWSLEEIFKSLQYLHSNGATALIDDEPGQPYELRIDKVGNTLCIWDNVQNQWIALGSLEENFGIKPNDIGAIEGVGDIKKIEMGNLTKEQLDALPTDGYSANDIYISAADNAVYRYTGTLWRVLLSAGDKGEILTVNDTAYAGTEANAGKILLLNANGKLNTDITGSPAQLLGKPISKIGNLADRQVLVYSPTANGGTGAFVNRVVDAVVGGGGGGLAGETLTLKQGDSILGTYNGETATTISIPTSTVPSGVLTVKQGNSTLGTYNGVADTVIAIPTVAPATTIQPLTITQGSSTLGTYNGSSVTSIAIPTVAPATTIQPLTITQGSSTTDYNGVLSKSVTIPPVGRGLTVVESRLFTGAGYQQRTVNHYSLDDNITINLSDSPVNTYLRTIMCMTSYLMVFVSAQRKRSTHFGSAFCWYLPQDSANLEIDTTLTTFQQDEKGYVMPPSTQGDLVTTIIPLKSWAQTTLNCQKRFYIYPYWVATATTQSDVSISIALQYGAQWWNGTSYQDTKVFLPTRNTVRGGFTYGMTYFYDMPYTETYEAPYGATSVQIKVSTDASTHTISATLQLMIVTCDEAIL